MVLITITGNSSINSSHIIGVMVKFSLEDMFKMSVVHHDCVYRNSNLGLAQNQIK